MNRTAASQGVRFVTIANGDLKGRWYDLQDTTATNPILSQKNAKPGTARFRATGRVVQKPRRAVTKDPLLGEEIEIIVHDEAYEYMEVTPENQHKTPQRTRWLCPVCSTRDEVTHKWTLPPMTAEQYEAHINEVHGGIVPIVDFDDPDGEEAVIDLTRGKEAAGLTPADLAQAAAPLGMHPDATKPVDPNISERVATPQEAASAGSFIPGGTPGNPAAPPITDPAEILAGQMGLTKDDLMKRLAGSAEGDPEKTKDEVTEAASETTGATETPAPEVTVPPTDGTPLVPPSTEEATDQGQSGQGSPPSVPGTPSE